MLWREALTEIDEAQRPWTVSLSGKEIRVSSGSERSVWMLQIDVILAALKF